MSMIFFFNLMKFLKAVNEFSQEIGGKPNYYSPADVKLSNLMKIVYIK